MLGSPHPNHPPHAPPHPFTRTTCPQDKLKALAASAAVRAAVFATLAQVIGELKDQA